MKKQIIILTSITLAVLFSITSCSTTKNSKQEKQKKEIVKKSENQELLNQIWIVDKIIIDGKTLVPKKTSTVSFDEKNKVGIRSDCNSGGANYKLNGNKIEISSIMATKMFCPESTEKDYFKALQSAESFSIKKNILTLKLKENKGEIIFHKK